jgi:hypothetical protein
VSTTALIILAVVVVLVAIGFFFFWQRRRTQNLQQQFGPEYKRTVDQYGDQRKAEAELVAREKRVRKLEIRALAPAEQSRFTEAWQTTQARFVDEPSQAVRDADRLVKEADFEQRAADVSVDHPNVVINYRAAHDIAARNNSGNATTEDLRQALVHYRSLFEELLEPTETATRKEAAS